MPVNKWQKEKKLLQLIIIKHLHRCAVLIKTLEKEFDTVFGLYAQVCFAVKEGQRHYTNGTHDEMTLAAFNKLCEDSGCKKGAWV